jgi:hypothetical protein
MISLKTPVFRFSETLFSSQRRCRSSVETTEMGNLRPIQSVDVSEVQRVVRVALRGGLNLAALRDFLASVDWSGTDRERPQIADLLGEIEAWSEAFSEGDLTQDEYIARLRRVLQAKDRAGIE